MHVQNFDWLFVQLWLSSPTYRNSFAPGVQLVLRFPNFTQTSSNFPENSDVFLELLWFVCSRFQELVLVNFQVWSTLPFHHDQFWPWSFHSYFLYNLDKTIMVLKLDPCVMGSLSSLLEAWEPTYCQNLHPSSLEVPERPNCLVFSSIIDFAYLDMT